MVFSHYLGFPLHTHPKELKSLPPVVHVLDMYDPQGPWPSGSNDTSRTTNSQYFAERANFSGFLLGAVFYGIVITISSRCVRALINPPGCMTNMRWFVTAHTVAMFSIVTVNTAMSLNVQSISYIDNRKFPGANDVPNPGPLGYRSFISSKPISIAPYTMFFVNNWLVDGLQLYRCYIIYSMNYWAIALPCLMYLGAVATGTMLICQASRPSGSISSIVSFGYPFFSISFSLNALLMFMIAIRLVLHARNIRNAVGFSSTAAQVYISVFTLLIESFSLHAASFMLYIVPRAVNSPISSIFFPILVQTQVIAPWLIITKVANRRASAGDTMSQDFMSSMEIGGESFSEYGTGCEAAAAHECP